MKIYQIIIPKKFLHFNLILPALQKIQCKNSMPVLQQKNISRCWKCFFLLGGFLMIFSYFLSSCSIFFFFAWNWAEKVRLWNKNFFQHELHAERWAISASGKYIAYSFNRTKVWNIFYIFHFLFVHGLKGFFFYDFDSLFDLILKVFILDFFANIFKLIDFKLIKFDLKNLKNFDLDSKY